MDVLNGLISKLKSRSSSKAGDECFGHIIMHTSRLGNSASYGLQAWAACDNGFSKIFGSRQSEMCKCPLCDKRSGMVSRVLREVEVLLGVLFDVFTRSNCLKIPLTIPCG